MVGGVLYTTAGTRRAAIALDAKTGELIAPRHNVATPRSECICRSGKFDSEAAAPCIRPACGKTC